MLSGLGDGSALGLRCAASPQRCRVSLVVLLPGEPMHDDDTIIVFQADRRAGLGDHQRIVANGRLHYALFLVALFADESAFTIIPACVHVL